jgi:hypothetical protein
MAGAAYFRLNGLGETAVTLEQLTLLRLAARSINIEMLPLAGYTVSGITNPPLVLYLLALPLRIQATLWSAFSFQVWLAVAAVPVLYLAAGQLFGRLAGLLAVFLLAFHPWAVAGNGTVLFFAVLVLAGFMLFLAGKPRTAYLGLAGFGLAALSQLQWEAWLLLPMAALLLLIFRRPGSFRPTLFGILIFILSYLPYLTFEQPRAFSDLLAGWHGLFSAGVLSGRDHLSSLSVVMAGLFAAALTYGVAIPLYWHRWQQIGWNELSLRLRGLFVLALWSVVPWLLSSLNPVKTYLLPALFLLLVVPVAGGLTYLHARLDGRTGRILSTLAVFLLGCLAFWLVETQLVGASVADGRSIREIDALIALSRERLAAYPDCGMVVLGVGNHADSSPIGLLDEFVYPREVRFVEQGRGLLLPEACVLYLLAGDDPAAEIWLQANGRLLPGAWPFYQLPPRGEMTAGSEPLAVWRNGLELLDYQVEGTAAPGQQLILQYTWHVIQQPRPRQHFHFFNHFLNEAGEIVAQEDGPGVHTAYWRPGDVLVTRFYLNLPPDLPAGRYTIQTGVYTWPELRRVRLRRSEETTYKLSPPLVLDR